MTGVVVTGCGAAGAFGPTRADLGRCLRGRARPERRRVEVEGDVLTVYRATWSVRRQWPGAPARLGRMDRASRMTLLAGHEALLHAGLGSRDLSGAAVAMGTRFGCLLVNEAYHRGLLTKGYRLASPLLFGYTVPSAPAGELSIAAGLKGPNLTVMAGDASGGIAVARAAAWLRAGRAEVALAGGCDVQGDWLAQETVDRGLIAGDPAPAEAAAVLVLERADHAAARGARVLARLDGTEHGRDDAGAAPRDPLARAIGRTYAASAPAAVIAALAGWLPGGEVAVRDELGYWVRLRFERTEDPLPGPA